MTRTAFIRLLGLAVTGLAATSAEARLVETENIEVTRHTVYLPDLPWHADGIVLAQLTDIHHGSITPQRVIRTAIQLTADANPDLVVLTGDFVKDDPIDAIRLSPLLAPLRAARLGMYGSLGNHDYDDAHRSGDDVANALAENAGVIFLRNDSRRILPGLHIAGIEDTLRGRINYRKAFAGVPHGAATIFLTHNPIGVGGVKKYACLALSGHTHGGQIRIPGLPPHFPPGMKGFPFIAGWGQFGKAWLYVNRGVGIGGVPFRFRCRPEVALFTLRRGESAPATLQSV